MQTQQNLASSSSSSVNSRPLAVFSSEFETVRQIKNDIGPENFKRAATSLHDLLYDLAKEKNLTLLEKIFAQNTAVLLIETDKETSQPVTLFSAKKLINGVSPSYYIAERASKNKELDVLHFLIDHFPDQIHIQDVLLAFAVNHDHAAIQSFDESIRSDSLRRSIVLIYRFLGYPKEEAAFRARTGYKDPLIISHPGIPYQLDQIDLRFSFEVMHFCWQAALKKEAISLLTLTMRFGYRIEDSLKDENQWIHLMLAHYNHRDVVKEILLQLLQMDLPPSEQKKHFKNFSTGAIKGGCYNTLCVLLALGANFRDMLVASVREGYLLQPYKLLRYNQHAAYLKKIPAKPAKPTTLSSTQVALIRKDLVKYLQLVCHIINEKEKVQHSPHLFYKPEESQPATLSNTSKKYKYLSSQYLKEVCERHHVNATDHTKIRAIETLILAVLDTEDPFYLERLNEMKTIFTAFLALLNDPKGHLDLQQLVNTPFRHLFPSQPYSMDASFIQYVVSYADLYFSQLMLLLTYVPNIMQIVWPNALAEKITLPMPTNGKTHSTTPLFVLMVNAKILTGVIQAYPDLIASLDTHHLFDEFFRDEADINITIESVASVAYYFLSTSEQSADFFIKSYGEALKHYIDNPSLLFLLLHKTAGIEWLKNNIQLLKNISPRVYKFAGIGQLFANHADLARLIAKDKALMRAFPPIYQIQFKKIKKEDPSFFAVPISADKKNSLAPFKPGDEKNSVILNAVDKAKQTFGEAIFKRACTELDQLVYDLAKEKNKDLLFQLLNVNIIIDPRSIDEHQIKQMQLFSLTRCVNGMTPLYYLAKRTSREGTWDILDFLLTVFPDLNKRDILTAYREDKNHEQLNLLLEKHPADEVTLKTNNEPLHLLKENLMANYSSYGADVDKVLAYCKNEKDISVEKLTAHFGYDIMAGGNMHLLIYALATYNHHVVLKKIIASLFSEHSNFEQSEKYGLICLKTAILSGSYETTCMILAFHGNLFKAVKLAFEANDLLLLSKLITLSHHACYYRETPPLKKATSTAPLTPNKELIAKREFTQAIKFLINIISTIDDTIKSGSRTIPIVNLSKRGGYLVTPKKQDGLQNIANQISYGVSSDTTFAERARLFNQVLSAWLPLCKDEKRSLQELLNTPLNKLFTTGPFSSDDFKVNLFQYIAHHHYEEYAYLRFILHLTADFLLFISPNSFYDRVSVRSLQNNALELAVITCLVVNKNHGVDLVMKYPLLLESVPTHLIFGEDYLLKDGSIIKIKNVGSMAMYFLEYDEKIAGFFLKKYHDQMVAQIDNPFLLFHLVSNPAGIAWLKNNIQLLKNISQTSYQFTDIMHCITSHPDLAELIAKDETLHAIFPEPYQTQFKLLHEKIKVESKKTVPLLKKSEQPKVSHDETALIKAIENRGYQQTTDFCVLTQNKQHEIIFATNGENTLAAIRAQFKNLHHVTLLQTSKGKMHEISLSFPSTRLPNVIEIFKTCDQLNKKPSYHGCIKEVLAKKEAGENPAPQKKGANQPAEKEGIQQEKWRQAIRNVFCDADISIEANPRKENSFIVSYPSTGTPWALKKSADQPPELLFVTDHHVRQLFINSLTMDFKKYASTTVEKTTKSGNKIIITPTSAAPPDVSSRQARHFKTLYDDHQIRSLPVIYGTKASKPVELSKDQKFIFTTFEESCKKHNVVDAKFVEKDSTLFSTQTSSDYDFVTTCTSDNVFKEMGLGINKKAKNLTAGILYSGILSGKHVDVLSVPDADDWAKYVAASADITGCSICIAHYPDDKFYALDPLGCGFTNMDNNKIMPTSFDNLQGTLQQDPIRILRAIKFQIRGREIDARYEAAIMDWQPTNVDVRQFSIKLYAEIQKMTSQITASDPFVLKWISFLRKYHLLTKVYQQDTKIKISDEAILVMLRGHQPYKTQQPTAFFQPKQGMAASGINALEQSVTGELPLQKSIAQPSSGASPS